MGFNKPFNLTVITSSLKWNMLAKMNMYEVTYHLKIAKFMFLFQPNKLLHFYNQCKCSPKRTQAQVFSKKRSSKKPFHGISKKKTFSQIFRKVSSVFLRKFDVSKNSAVLGQGQGNFRGLEASRPRTWPSRPRTTKCVLEAKNNFEDSISAMYVIVRT